MRSAGTGTPPSRDCDPSGVQRDSKAKQQMDFSLLNLLQSQKKKAPSPAPPELLGHPKQLNTNLSKVVRVLLVVGAILRRTKVIQNRRYMESARAEEKHTHDVAVVGFGHQQHPAHQVRGGDALRPLALPETRPGVTTVSRGPGGSLFCSPVSARRLHLFVGVFAVHR